MDSQRNQNIIVMNRCVWLVASDTMMLAQRFWCTDARSVDIFFMSLAI